MIGNLVRSVLGLPEQRAAATPASYADDWGGWLGVRSPAGVTVTPDAALGVTTVMACVGLIARSLASVPLVLYRRVGETGRDPAVEHPLYPILHDLANPILTAFDVRQALFASALLYGNGYAEVVWGSDGYPAALWPLAPDRVTLWVTPAREIYYTVQDDDGSTRRLADYQMHHLRGLMTHGYLGISPLRAANAIGLAMAAEQFGSRFFGSGAHPSMVLSHPARLTPEGMRNLRQSFENQWSGLSNAHRVAVVAEGVTANQVSVRADEAQVLETRMFQVLEICRIFNVSPGLVGAAETQTYASAEQDMIRFRELALGPWAEAEEKCIYRDLLTPAEQPVYFAQHKLSKLQATDLKTRYESHQIAVLSGIGTPNERRELEDLNPMAGGDELWMPLNMALASQVAKQAAASTPSTPSTGSGAGAEDDQTSDDQTDEADALRQAWLADVQRRLVARIENDVRQQGAKALRNGGRLALSEWGEGMQHGWRMAGEEMLAALRQAQGPGQTPAADVADWVSSSYQAAVREMIDGN